MIDEWCKVIVSGSFAVGEWVVHEMCIVRCWRKDVRFILYTVVHCAQILQITYCVTKGSYHWALN